MTELSPFPDGAVVRPARPSDVPGILDCIRALAVYEKEPDAVENTEEMLAGTLFGENPQAFAHVVVKDEQVRGIALWFLSYSTWTGRHGIWLEDVYVYERFRGSGYGTALLSALAAICVERGYSRLEWTVLDWNEPSIAFYRSIGAVPQDEWTTQRLIGDDLATLAGR
ncbi:MAG: GNAT family N-acetyltransferase [Corynebacterium sp.]|uniref:GNAT family N-acetyltransferase n=1 Tax=Corynebacterium sp. TaxID=1720 RepID=UPI002649CE21|nr:GNAT family N-acetyltransferase [Corynebacterium sp.]MDN5721662.1 GNAT family N-acetyltransferase [Corynebacterium sp.]MDN6282135.1 GNAT family N-acetyltransferase [Corynebacterium sp.]MDN6305983.1 GNAT family N-acetyltransferase [Corynebacterium sp.]MDN6351795.1 GNAT family N-acetyltransferase [Corynebacterium sp.]MDN6366531.1 GNAT family N-acetyltransferase [Corynebacterium sp.]